MKRQKLINLHIMISQAGIKKKIGLRKTNVFLNLSLKYFVILATKTIFDNKAS